MVAFIVGKKRLKSPRRLITIIVILKIIFTKLKNLDVLFKGSDWQSEIVELSMQYCAQIF